MRAPPPLAGLLACLVLATSIGPGTLRADGPPAPPSTAEQPGTSLVAEAPAAPGVPVALPPEEVAELVSQVFNPDLPMRQKFLMLLRGRGEPDVVPGLIQVMRYVQDDGWIDRTIAALTDQPRGQSWNEWLLFQQAHPEIVPFEGFDAFKADVLAVIDPEFRRFVHAGVAHDIRLEEIVWGGVKKDGIPALTNPTLIPARQAHYLQDDELVFGIEIEGDARAYPLRIMDWHEMLNDVVGGVPVSLAYCTLCGSGILYDTRVPGQDEPLVFGSSGLLYRSNKLMYDQTTHSLWNQFTGRPVVGPLTGSGLALTTLPVTITSWADWQASHPDSQVLSLATGHQRDYTPGRPYGEYFASDKLMFPVLVPDERLAAKAQVFALRLAGHERAWPLADFASGQVINDQVGDLGVVLIGDQATRTVRAYRAEGHRFEAAGEPTVVSDGDQRFQVSEGALIGPAGERLERLPGHVGYWFAWQSFVEGAPLAGSGAR